jgi:hypothetical protein
MKKIQERGRQMTRRKRGESVPPPPPPPLPPTTSTACNTCSPLPVPELPTIDLTKMMSQNL